MTFQAQDVMNRAATTLQDLSSVRWPATELHGYLNDGLREIVTIKPNARSETVVLQLEEGTKQTLDPAYTVLSRISRNMDDALNGGAVISPLDSRSIMDSMIPGWQDPSVVPNHRTVVHVIHDIVDPNTFYVVPGNDGTGLVEAVVGQLPAVVATPANPASIASYVDVVDINDIYLNALTDYLLFRAYSKDARVAGSAVRAAAHFEAFRTGVTGFANAENGMALSTHASMNQQATKGG